MEHYFQIRRLQVYKDQMTGDMIMKNIPVLIPAYNPGEELVKLVEALINEGVAHIVIVNDGSQSQCKSVFQQAGQFEQCHVLHHAVNLGKGRALKTGFNYIYLNHPNAPGIVTADSDGQHKAADISKVIHALALQPEHLVIGVRKMSGKVPFRSLFGNVCTRFVFSLMTGQTVSDTQSGLRGIPLSFIPSLLELKGERYEFEINMLMMTRSNHVPVAEVSIDTIYIEDNKSSHFNPFFDSMKIYFQLLRFAFSSLIASCMDFIVFSLVFGWTGNILAAILLGRFLVGSLLNYAINRRLVFRSGGGVLWSLLKYYLALVTLSVISYLAIVLVIQQLGLGVLTAKILVETLLFAVSFSVQREFVFTHSPED